MAFISLHLLADFGKTNNGIDTPAKIAFSRALMGIQRLKFGKKVKQKFDISRLEF